MNAVTIGLAVRVRRLGGQFRVERARQKFFGSNVSVAKGDVGFGSMTEMAVRIVTRTGIVGRIIEIVPFFEHRV